MATGLCGVSSFCLWQQSCASRVHLTKGVQLKIQKSSAYHSLSSLTRKQLVICRAVESQEPLDLTEENVERVLLDARNELLQIFDTSVGITGVAELADMDGPFLKLRLKGRFWHERSVVLARLGNYLQKRIPEIVQVEIEDESQLDDSPANFGHG